MSNIEDARYSLAQQQATNNPGGMGISNWEVVEVPVPANATGRIPFVQQDKLRNQADQIVWVQNMEAFPDSSYAFSQKTNTIPGMPATEIPKIAVVIVASGWEKQHLIPLSKFIKVNDLISPFQFWMQYFNTMEDVQWESCYLQYNSTGAAFAYVVPFGVTYLKANVS